MRSYLFLLLIVVFGVSCGNNAGKTEAEVTQTQEESFLNFRKKFLRDTAYQMAHITFPLSGRPDKEHADDTLPNGQFVWTRANWDYHRELDAARSGFEVKYTWLTDNLVEETLVNEQIGLGMMRRFSRINEEEWELIYYVGMSGVK
ncbi:MAG: hypothetical protein DWQ02_15870 [Bacteroidetes bacterium]|nr:MAG: hypothetical protein DWQ02_15870 [Bacteroidota bacterium]